MIAKCIAILAVVAQLTSASGCGCGQSSIVLPNSECSSQSSPIVLVSSGNSGRSFGDSSASGAITRNFVAKGKYPVAMKSCGPNSDQQIPVTISRVTAPVQEKPAVRLPARIPPPKTVSHSCTCYKTILRPRVHQQIITVPTVQRYFETSHTPVVENIQYEALPVNCDGLGYSSGSGLQLVQVGPDSSSLGSVELVSVGSGCSCGSQVQAIEIPTVQVPQIQTVHIPQSVSFASGTGQC